MEIKQLKKEIPYKWRVQSFSEYKAQAVCVPYIDSRQAQDLFDEVCGDDWQDDYFPVNKKTYCKIAIRINDEWRWRSDCGVESHIEAEKGEASDAFKRAGVKWGVGRFLYKIKPQYVKANEKKVKKPKPNYPYCITEDGRRIFDLTEYLNDRLAGIFPSRKASTELMKYKPATTVEAARAKIVNAWEFLDYTNDGQVAMVNDFADVFDILDIDSLDTLNEMIKKLTDQANEA